MGKNKSRQKRKLKNIMKVAGNTSMKAKGKSKAVHTNLKRINQQNRAQVAKANEQLAALQEAASSKPKQQQLQQKKATKTPPPSKADVDTAAAGFSQL